MKIKIFILLATIATSCVNQIPQNEKENEHSDAIFQYSTKNGLITNDYIGTLDVKTIKQNGDFGLGTYNMVNGEMVIYDGNVYQVTTQNKINNMSDEVLSPFVVTKFFQSDTVFSIDGNISLDSLKSILTKNIKKPSLPIAVKIKAKFLHLQSRSVDKAENLSTTLDEIVAKQTIFNFDNVEGKIIGFWYPNYFDGVNFPDFHLHVLLNDLSGGGHLLDCVIENPVVEFDYATSVNIIL